MFDSELVPADFSEILIVICTAFIVVFMLGLYGLTLSCIINDSSEKTETQQVERKEDMPPTEYKTINGELHWRDRNNPQWKKCSLKQMTYLYNMELQGRKELNEKNEKLREKIDKATLLFQEQ